MIHTFIVSTHNYLLRVAVDLETRRMMIDQIDDGALFFGIAFVNGDIVYSKRLRIKNPYGEAVPCTLPDKMYRAGRVLPLDLLDVHQIIWHEGHLFITECFRNRLLMIKGAIDYGSDYWMQDVVFGSTASDMNHPNSVTPLMNNWVAVMLHNGPRPGNKNSEVIYVQVHPAGVANGIELPYQGCHNIVYDDNRAFINASQDGLIAVFNVKDAERWEQEHELTIGREGYTHNKGLVVTDDYIIAGLSRDNNWHQRFYGDGYLVFVPRSMTGEASWIKLREVGNINDIYYVGGVESTLEYNVVPNVDHLLGEWETDEILMEAG